MALLCYTVSSTEGLSATCATNPVTITTVKYIQRITCIQDLYKWMKTVLQPKNMMWNFVPYKGGADKNYSKDW